MKKYQLNNDLFIPLVGLGCNTFGKENKDYQAPLNYDTTEIINAISVGYRHLDTAISYRNEAVIGKAVLESGLPRSEFFLTSKLPGQPEYTANDKLIDEALNNSLKALNTDYIDLYLIHHPWDDLDEMLNTWRRLEHHVKEKRIKSIGVSNFSISILEELLKKVEIKPVVNQIESNLGNLNHELIEYCLNEGILPVAYSPLKKSLESQRDVLNKIGEKYQKSWAQVLLRYQTSRNVAVIPKSYQIAHQKDNLNIFDFNLTQEEIIQISLL